jgi:lipopolysaccharide transport system ATP-binding protein
MSNTIIQVENLSKQYRLGEVGTGTLSHDLNRWWAKMRGKDDPFSKIGEINDRTKKSLNDYVWALRDINFQVNQGDVLGIIGSNGAGKSTLLKLLSKVTKPSAGSIKVKGRIASLLEVGTGFHPELTGKENIFLNGAIMGMTKFEIKSKFDEIVDFAGVERYVDTPVKRYSSGMYVRLAFAIAAHLDPEILIVDEVLAVGDAEFQKKCLGKMKDVSVNDGRTVLFVSHNMGSIAELCNTGILMSNGRLTLSDTINNVIHQYVSSNSFESYYKNLKDRSCIYVDEVAMVDDNFQRRNLYLFTEKIFINIDLKNTNKAPKNVHISIVINDKMERPIFSSHFKILDNNDISKVCVEIPNELLLPGSYYLKVILHVPYVEFVQNDVPLLNFEIEDSKITEHSMYTNANLGVINSKSVWHVK